MKSLSFALAMFALGGCQGVLPEPDFERMIWQHHYLPFQTAPYFADKRVMRPLVPGTVSFGTVIGKPDLTEGMVDGKYVEHFPIKVTHPVLERGRNRFEIFCAACHGMRGDGVSEVANNMELRRPPVLTTERVRGFAPGRIFRIASYGYGIMPSYAHELSTEDRWAVVAYVKALGLSQEIALNQLPPAVRQEAERNLPK